jgi:hypothetical protein
VRLLPEVVEALQDHRNSDSLVPFFDIALPFLLRCHKLFNMASSKAPSEGEQQRYDENEKYGLHPDDVLIMYCFPEAQIGLEDSSDRRRKLDLAQIMTLDLTTGPITSDPLSPRRPRSQLEPGVEEWRQPRLQMIDEQLAL